MVQEEIVDNARACVKSVDDLGKWELGMIREFPPDIVEDLKKRGKIRRLCGEE